MRASIASWGDAAADEMDTESMVTGRYTGKLGFTKSGRDTWAEA